MNFRRKQFIFVDNFVIFPRSFHSAHIFLPPTQWCRPHEAFAAVGILLALFPGHTKWSMFKDVFYRNVQPKTSEKMMKNIALLVFFVRSSTISTRAKISFSFVPSKSSVFFLTAAELLIEGHLLM
jgi:hypothetical protein